MKEPFMSDGAMTYTCAILSGASVEEARVMARGDDIFEWYRAQLVELREENEELEAKVEEMEWDQNSPCFDCDTKDDEIEDLRERIEELEAALAAKGAA